MKIKTDNFNYIRAFLAEQSAVVLDDGKEYLVESRLRPLAREEGFEDINDYVESVRQHPSAHHCHQSIIEALVTNETFFFRDFHPFEALRVKVIPEIIQRNAVTRSLRIWCGACSTGQEPYSIAMLLLKEFPQLESWFVQIIATDLSTRALDYAHTGCYSQLEINRGLPAPYLVRFFQQLDNGWHIKEEVKQMVKFWQMNLLDAWSHVPPCDVVFLRNVLIYFKHDSRRAIFDRLPSALAKNALLFLGGGESMVGIHDGFTAIDLGAVTAYRVRGDAAPRS